MKHINLISVFVFFSTVAFSSSAKEASPPGPSNALVVDVRTAKEYAAGHIPGSVLFPYDDLPAKADSFAALVGEGGKTRPIVVY